MKKIINIISILVLIQINPVLADRKADDRYFYIGSELGLAEPVVKSFIYKDDFGRKTRMRLKQSKMFGGRVGYSFYPNMMIEVSYTHQPKYRLAYILPEVSTPVGFTIPETSGQTRVSSDVVTLNWIYEMEEQLAGIKPYMIVGAGVSKVSIKPTISHWKTPVPIPNLGDNIPYFRVQKNNINCFTWQAGLGFSKNLTDNFAIDIGGKLQVVNNIKIRYDTLDSGVLLSTGTLKYNSAKPIKKTIAVGEFTLGFTFKLPI